jgi:hypothetical protein
MMTFYRIGEPGVACVDLESCPVLTQSAVWIDLFEPSHDEEKTVEAALGFEVPTREEMQMQRFGFESPGKLGQPWAIALIFQRNPKAGIAYKNCP